MTIATLEPDTQPTAASPVADQSPAAHLVRTLTAKMLTTVCGTEIGAGDYEAARRAGHEFGTDPTGTVTCTACQAGGGCG